MNNFVFWDDELRIVQVLAFDVLVCRMREGNGGPVNATKQPWVVVVSLAWNLSQSSTKSFKLYFSVVPFS